MYPGYFYVQLLCGNSSLTAWGFCLSRYEPGRLPWGEDVDWECEFPVCFLGLRLRSPWFLLVQRGYLGHVL